MSNIQANYAKFDVQNQPSNFTLNQVAFKGRIGYCQVNQQMVQDSGGAA